MHSEGSKHKQLVVIGAGPCGLAAALYAAREGIDTLVLEKSVIGGLAAVTDRIDNYPGFDEGVGGLELSDRLADHAKRFGAEIRTGVDVAGLHGAGDSVQLETSIGAIETDAVLIATGSTFKHLGIPGEQVMISRGVHFCATCDAPLYKGKVIVVVGGGNTAVQEALFIAKFAHELTLLVRGPELRSTRVLMEQLRALPNVRFRFNTEVDEILSDGAKVTAVRILDKTANTHRDLSTDAVFVLIGLTPNTKEFSGALDLDERGFIITKPNFTTSVPGVFAAGDVRSGATWQIASAVGEGVSATLSIRAYLDSKRAAEHKYGRRERPTRQRTDKQRG